MYTSDTAGYRTEGEGFAENPAFGLFGLDCGSAWRPKKKRDRRRRACIWHNSVMLLCIPSGFGFTNAVFPGGLLIIFRPVHESINAVLPEGLSSAIDAVGRIISKIFHFRCGGRGRIDSGIFYSRCISGYLQKDYW